MSKATEKSATWRTPPPGDFCQQTMPPPSIHLDASFLAEQKAKAAARAARFAQEAAKGPPPLPVKRLAHPGGKIVTSDRQHVLTSLLERKIAAGEQLTAEQEAAARANRLSLQQRDGTASTLKRNNIAAAYMESPASLGRASGPVTQSELFELPPRPCTEAVAAQHATTSVVSQMVNSVKQPQVAPAATANQMSKPTRLVRAKPRGRSGGMHSLLRMVLSRCRPTAACLAFFGRSRGIISMHRRRPRALDSGGRARSAQRRLDHPLAHAQKRR